MTQARLPYNINHCSVLYLHLFIVKQQIDNQIDCIVNAMCIMFGLVINMLYILVWKKESGWLMICDAADATGSCSWRRSQLC